MESESYRWMGMTRQTVAALRLNVRPRYAWESRAGISLKSSVSPFRVGPLTWRHRFDCVSFVV